MKMYQTRIQPNKLRKLLMFYEQKNIEYKATDENKDNYFTAMWKITNDELTLAQHVIKWYFIIAILKFTLEILLYIVQLMVLLSPFIQGVFRVITRIFLDFVQRKKHKMKKQKLEKRREGNSLFRRKMITLFCIFSMIQIIECEDMSKNSVYVQGTKSIETLNELRRNKIKDPLYLRFEDYTDRYEFEIGHIIDTTPDKISKR